MKAKAKNSGRSVTVKNQSVHFEFDDPAARKVSIAGTFNGWDPNGNEMNSMGSGKWVKDLDLAPGTYEYRFVIDGKWTNDPGCAHTVPNAFGETNSLLIVPGPKRKAEKRQRASAREPVMS